MLSRACHVRQLSRTLRGIFSVLKIKAKKMYANAGVVWLKGRTPSPAANALVAELQTQIKELEQLGRSVLMRTGS